MGKLENLKEWQKFLLVLAFALAAVGIYAVVNGGLGTETEDLVGGCVSVDVFLVTEVDCDDATSAGEVVDLVPVGDDCPSADDLIVELSGDDAGQQLCVDEDG